MLTLYFFAIFAVVAVLFVRKAVFIVPQQSAYIVERLGKYHASLEAGLHVLVPFVDRVRYRIPLQEIPLDQGAQQAAITKDNVTVEIDGVLYYQVTNPAQAAYGTSNYVQAIEMLARTTLRSEVGKRDLDKLLEDRTAINEAVIQALDEAATKWGVKVLRFEVKDITPPEVVLKAMQMQLTAEREKRAVIARSEGQRAEDINIAEGKKAAAIAESEGERQAAINRAQGEAQAVLALAAATASAIEKVAAATQKPGGDTAVQLQVAEKYVDAFANLARQSTTLVIPANLADLSSLIAASMSVIQAGRTPARQHETA